MTTLSNDEFENFAPPGAAAKTPGATVSHDEFENMAAPQKNYALSEIPGAALKNAGHSAGEFASNLVQPFIHPIDTAVGIKNLGQGVLEKAGVLSGDEHKKYADAVGEHLTKKYGGWENIKRSLAEDPVGTLADASMVLTGGGAAAARLPGIAGKVGEVVQTAGRYTDPINLTGKAASAAMRVGPEQRMLEKAGVEMTPGHLVPGPAKGAKTLEDAATSIPGLGYFIHSAREASIKSFNEAVANQALEPVKNLVASQHRTLHNSSTGNGGVWAQSFRDPEHFTATNKAGHELIGEVAEKLGSAYDSLLPHISLSIDNKFIQDLGRIRQTIRTDAPASFARQLDKIVFDRLRGHDPIPGVTVKSIESELGNLAGQYGKSGDAGQRILGTQLKNVVKAMRANVERTNPGFTQELQAINHGWAMYSRMRDAASNRATSMGVFTPADLLRAVKRGDKTVQHGAFARGDALMQKFAEAGQKVLPSTVPDSGTPTRLLTQHLLSSGAVGAGAHMAGMLSPAAVATAAALGIPYTRPGMWATNKVLRPIAKNPKYVRGAINTAYRTGQLGQSNPYAPKQYAEGGGVSSPFEQPDRDAISDKLTDYANGVGPPHVLPDWFPSARESFPSAEEVYNRTRPKGDVGSGMSYGTALEPYVDNRLARVTELSRIASSHQEHLDAATKAARVKEVKTLPLALRAALHNQYGETEAIARRSPLMALGFDPRYISLTKNALGGRSTVTYGMTDNGAPYDIWSSANRGTMAHEIAHRGANLVRNFSKKGADLYDAAAEALSVGSKVRGSEALARYLMMQYSGDAEQRQDQREDVLNNLNWLRRTGADTRALARVKALEDYAARMYAAKKTTSQGSDTSLESVRGPR